MSLFIAQSTKYSHDYLLANICISPLPQVNQCNKHFIRAFITLLLPLSEQSVCGLYGPKNVIIKPFVLRCTFLLYSEKL